MMVGYWDPIARWTTPRCCVATWRGASCIGGVNSVHGQHWNWLKQWKTNKMSHSQFFFRAVADPGGFSGTPLWLVSKSAANLSFVNSLAFQLNEEALDYSLQALLSLRFLSENVWGFKFCVHYAHIPVTRIGKLKARCSHNNRLEKVA